MKKRVWISLVGVAALAVVLLACSIISNTVFGTGGPNSLRLPTTSAPPPVWVDPQQTLPPDMIIEGVWHIGEQAQPRAGIYVLTKAAPRDGLCYWQVSTDDAGQDILSNGNPTGGRPQVTLKKGQWFTTRNCGDWALKTAAKGGGLADLKFVQAKPIGQVTYVTEDLSSIWPVGAAVSAIDRYTSSSWKIVSKCPRTAWRCVNLRVGAVAGGKNAAIGTTSCSGGSCTVRVDHTDSKRAGFTSAQRKWLLVHELGHSVGLGHRSACSTSMYQYRTCRNGKIPPIAFDGSQRATMAWR